MIKKFDFRAILGIMMIALGGLMALENLGIFPGASSLFWGLVWVAVSIYFFYTFSQNTSMNWLALIPAFVLLGIGIQHFLPSNWEFVGGALFLGAIGLAFVAIYLQDTAHWWGIIPSGTLLTLAFISILEEQATALDTGGILFIGLGITFLLVAILPNKTGRRMDWAFIPALVLILFGAFLGSSALSGLAFYIIPAALILAGVFFIFRFFKTE